MPVRHLISTLCRTFLIGSIFSALAMAQLDLIRPTPCEQLVVRPEAGGNTWVRVNFENRSDATLHLFRRLPDGTKHPSTVLKPHYAEQRSGRPGAVWIIEDGEGKCLAGYTAGSQDGSVQIGDGGLRVEIQPTGRMSFTAGIFPDNSLRTDGTGPYRHGDSGVVAVSNLGIILCTDQRTCSTLPERARTDPAKRALVLDLGSPVLNSGAKDLRVLHAPGASFCAFWGQDNARRVVNNGREGPMIRIVSDIDVGSSVESERIEIRFFLNGKQHILQFGPWTAGQYQASQGSINGESTTAGSITRVSETKWRVQSGRESVGRLWDNHDPAHPGDLGLYRFSYRIEFDRN